jgi:hypothetical protein
MKNMASATTASAKITGWTITPPAIAITSRTMPRINSIGSPFPWSGVSFTQGLPALTPIRPKHCATAGTDLWRDPYFAPTYKFGLDGKYKKGKFKAKGKVASGTYKGQYKISFTTGRLKKHKGRWFKSTSGQYEIALKNPNSGYESIYCDRR